MAGLAGESVLCHQHRQSRLGSLFRHRHRRAGGRHSREQSGQQMPNCSKRWAKSSRNTTTISSSWCGTFATRKPTNGRASSNESNEFGRSNFAHARIRRIHAENLLDCISQVTETKDKFAGLPLGARAAQIADGTTSTYFLTTFGRSHRQTVCSCDVKTDPTLSQALHLINGDTIEKRFAMAGSSSGRWKRQDARTSDRRDLYPLPVAQTDTAGNGKTDGDCRSRPIRCRDWKTYSGRC